jgi:hypothetical protein
LSLEVLLLVRKKIVVCIFLVEIGLWMWNARLAAHVTSEQVLLPNVPTGQLAVTDKIILI